MNGKPWIQILLVAASVMLTGGGMIASGTYVLGGIRADNAAAVAAARLDSAAALALLAAKVAADEERLSAMEKLEADHHTGELAFQSEMRSSINTIISSLADVRVAVGGRNHGTK
jgi:hypothetical protein